MSTHQFYHAILTETFSGDSIVKNIGPLAENFYIYFLSLLCICVYMMCVFGKDVPQHMDGGQHNHVESVLSCHPHLNSRDWRQAARLAKQTLTPLSHPASPKISRLNSQNSSPWFLPTIFNIHKKKSQDCSYKNSTLQLHFKIDEQFEILCLWMIR